MSFTPAEQAPTLPGVGALPEPSDLAVAIRVGQKLLAAYGDSSGFDVFAYAQAHGALAEALRILLRAVGAEPAEAKGSSLVRTPGGGQRCPAAHPDDPTPCSGPPTVTVLDRHNAGADGCQHHAARLLASLDGGTVYGLPHATPGTAIRVFQAAAGLRPFCWVERGEGQ